MWQHKSMYLIITVKKKNKNSDVFTNREYVINVRDVCLQMVYCATLMFSLM